ncbi:SCAR/WAVE family [Parasponia andersonii]|uniref:Protein SCAR n=1 Tax=Parasponia andersonii TaxID=3476 RepID=A0A2P5AXT4_PARAD|nr:SCAR/WAVE family [Parasponia andersonii]
MPLVRFHVRNEFGLGNSELHSRANKEDPKAVLDGAAVAGLVGILRQLGDLAEFAGEVFHGLQEQVMATASRSHKLMVRVQHIEAALPPLEKVVLSQTSHIHFAYTAGSEWHPRIQNERNHFIKNDLPHFIMDSYEECRGPPRLHLLDKFDTGGPGSCLKRYSDPTFFKRASAVSDEANAEKVLRDRKARRSKKKRSSKQNGDVSRGASISNTRNNSMRFIPPIVDGRSSPLHTASTVDMALKYDMGDKLNSFDSRAESGYIECVFHPSSSMQAGEQEAKDSLTLKMAQHDNTLDSVFASTFKMAQHNDTHDSVFADEHVGFIDDCFRRSSLQEQITSGSSCVTWDEKAEIMEPKIQESGLEEMLDLHQNTSETDAIGCGAGNFTIVDQMEIFGNKSVHERTVDQMEMLRDKTVHERTADQMEVLGDNNIHELISSTNEIDQIHEIDEIESEPDNYMDALNTIESESENDLDYQTKREVEQFSSVSNNEGTEGMHELTVHCSDLHDGPSTFESHSASFVSTDKEVLTDLHDSVTLESCGHEQMPTSDISSNRGFVSTDKEVLTDLHDSVSLESCGHEQMPKSDISSNREEPSDLSNSFSVETHVDFQMPPQARGSSTDHAGITKIADILEGSELESPITDPSSSVTRSTDAQDPLGNKTTSNIWESDESRADIPSNHSMRFWTNGGLLGLQPSKPPDFAMSSIARDSVNGSKTDTAGPLNPTCTLKDEMHGGKLNTLVEDIVDNEKDSSSKCSTSCRNDKENGISTKKTSQGSSTNYLDSTDGNADDFHIRNGFRNASKNYSKETRVPETGKVLPVASNVKYNSTETNQEHDENSSLAFGFSRRLLSNGFSRTVSDMNEDKFQSASSMCDSVLEQENEHPRVAHQRVPEVAFKEHFGFGSAVDSPSSSPPLEHMKISFHPIDDFETSKLKLKFSDGTQSHESIGDMFPSFQLIPEPAIPLHNYDSDSDDDTFCRSSPCMSDDCLSQHSESNSEQWECGENMGDKNHSMHDAVHGIASMERISGSLDLDGITNSEICFDGGGKCTNSGKGVHLSPFDPILDLPSFDAVKPAIQHEMKDDSESRCHIDPPPTPPPLPPAEWRVSKSHLDVAEDIMDVSSEDFRHAFDAKLLGSTTSQQPRQAPEGHQNNESTVKPKSKEGQQKLNGEKEAKHALKSNAMDEREDFLQQIRTKSFNLRRTVPSKPTTTTSGPTANNQVTAILEKANAIRQAVGSDDGEDDTWSDT